MSLRHLIQVHPVQLSASDAQFKQRFRSLSPQEQVRADRFRFRRDQVRWTSSRLALRSILAARLKAAPDELVFGTGVHGKPYLLAPHPSPDGDTDGAMPDQFDRPLEFNLSHSGDLALIAVSRTLEVGCDVEPASRRSDGPAVARRFFSEAEQRELAGLSPELRPHAFMLCWTRKEAVIKATGEGLYADLGAFDVNLTPGHAARVVHERRVRYVNIPWHLQHVDLDDGYVGAVAARSHSAPRITMMPPWQFND